MISLASQHQVGRNRFVAAVGCRGLIGCQDLVDDRVGQILIDIDSPGGCVYGVAELASQIVKTRVQEAPPKKLDYASCVAVHGDKQLYAPLCHASARCRDHCFQTQEIASLEFG